ncbi:MAG: hypothetical protein HeimC3_37060, partial [Candidatus Heimdallarchaeota archaeon LC_3]
MSKEADKLPLGVIFSEIIKGIIVFQDAVRAARLKSVMVDLIEQGYNYREIKEILKLSPEEIFEISKEIDVSYDAVYSRIFDPKKQNYPDKSDIVFLIDHGCTYREMQERLNISAGTMYRALNY